MTTAVLPVLRARTVVACTSCGLATRLHLLQVAVAPAARQRKTVERSTYRLHLPDRLRG